jgi:indole-3-glycerol phosphate synthase
MSRNFLAEIVARKWEEIAELRRATNASELRDHALAVRSQTAPHRFRQPFIASSPDLKIIAEFKRRSPSVGTLRADALPSDIARAYARGGATAISVLTDAEHFNGSLDDIAAVRSVSDLPLLRKDFILDPLQVYEAAGASADAILLIVAALDDDSLGQLRALAEDELGLDALVEVHDADELRRAIAAGATLIGVNNRDLLTFTVSLETSERLIAQAPQNAVMISESGLRHRQDLQRLHDAGFRGFLIGETLMRAADPEHALRDLIG